MITSTSEGLKFSVKISLQAMHNEICGIEHEALKIRIKTVPEKGKANMMIRRLLADFFGICISDIEILSGHTHRIKRILIKTKSHQSILDKWANLPNLLK